MRNDQIFVLLLVVLLPLSGCMDNTVGDAEGTDDIDSDVTVVNHYYNQTTNHPPIIHMASIGQTGEFGEEQEADERRSTYNQTTGEEESRMYYRYYGLWFSVIDADGNITAVGIDGDLDLTIDHEFSLDANSSWSDITYHESYGFAWSNTTNGGVGSWGGGFDGYCYLRFNLIAIDNDGGLTVNPYTMTIGNNQGCDVWDD